jgi:transposase-like protein
MPERTVFPMSRHHDPYPPEFRARAVELLRTSGKGVPEMAKELGISDQALRNWVRQADIDAGRGKPGELTTAEREELSRLRREVRVLREEREILKKAAAFFAKESETR